MRCNGYKINKIAVQRDVINGIQSQQYDVGLSWFAQNMAVLVRKLQKIYVNVMIHNLLFLSKTVILGHRGIPQVLEKPDSSEDAWINNQKHDDLTHEQCIGKSSQNVYLMIIYIYIYIQTSSYIPLNPITYHYIPLSYCWQSKLPVFGVLFVFHGRVR